MRPSASGDQVWSGLRSQLRRKEVSANDIWYHDEVVIKIQGQRYYLWRAVDQDGYILVSVLDVFSPFVLLENSPLSQL